jgi:phage shock protein PspC (stress-responsive transcriptional regulator)
LDEPPDDDSLAIADAVARAAYIWIRSLCLNEFQQADERRFMASGLIAGLCERLDVDPSIHELITYIYALLDNDADGSLDSTRVISQKAMAPENLSARQRGVQEADAIVEMLVYHRNRIHD